jgi:hypothetical protein
MINSRAYFISLTEVKGLISVNKWDASSFTADEEEEEEEKEEEESAGATFATICQALKLYRKRKF